MNITWLSCLGIMFFVNAIFDTVYLLIRFLGHTVFAKSFPWYLNLIHGLLIAGPVLQGLGAFLCYKIYERHTNPELAHWDNAPDYGVGGMGSRTRHQTFQGPGQRLGTA